MNEDKKIVTEVVVGQPTATVSKPLSLYDTHMKENFHIFGLASILYGLLYVFCMFKNDAGITYSVFVAGTIAYIWFLFGKLEMKFKKESRFYVVCMLLLSVSTFCTDDWRIIFCNKTGVFLLSISMLLGVIYDTKKWNLGKHLGSIAKVCIMSFGEIGKPFSDAIWYCKNKLDKKNSKYLYLLLGFGITIPLFVIVFLLLSSADIVFRDMADHMLANISGGDVCLMILMFLLMAVVSYCLTTYLAKKELKEETKDYRKWEPLIGIPVATVLSLLYLVFSAIQIVYLFMGKMQLPAGYTYAEYAREGFFQLLAVSILNLVIVLVGLYFFKPSMILKAVLTVMSLCTFIMIASSALRMVIYIQYYYLTFLRILVLWSLLVLFLIFVGVIIYIAKETFPLFRYSLVVFTCLYIGLSFSHPDYWIAKVNLASTEDSRNDFFKGEAYEDYMFLSDLSADAAPILVEWLVEEGYSTERYYEDTMTYNAYQILNGSDADEETELAVKEWCAYMYLKHIGENCKERSVREFNVSRFLADLEVSSQRTKGM
ncbi:MAG: DUF4173 domain-containing protein [Agathobacter sp.]|nr:DUF4173 domain-containing protein [Agathobacter sp.]